MRFSLKTTHKIFLLLLAPLLITTVSLGVVWQVSQQIEADREKESKTLDQLLHVNMTFNDLVSAAASLMMFSVWQEPGYLLEFNDKYTNLKRNHRALQELTNAGGEGSSKEIETLVSIIGDAMETFESADEMAQSSFEKDNVATIEKLKSFLRRMDTAGSSAIEEQLSTRKRFRTKENERRTMLLNFIAAAVILNLVVATIAAIVFTRTFATRFRILVEDMQKVATGRVIESHLRGSDEISILDQIVHKLSYELDAARQMERAMIDNTAEIICSLDESFRLQEVNKAVKKRLGYDIEELLGTNVQSLIHPDDRDETYKDLEYCRNNVEEISFEVRLKKRDGRFTHTEWNAKWAPENKSFFCVMHDVTERKEAEKLKQEVLAMVSHDLRAPLTSIGMTLDMVQEGMVGELDQRGEKLINRAKYSATSLITMINDLIDVERFEAGGLKLNYESVVATDVAGPALDLVSPEAERKKIQLEIDVDRFDLKVDKERLNRVVMNLVNNAIKFTPEGKRITLSGKLMHSKSGRPYAEFQVIDEGPGIASDKLDLVFEKFKQAGTGSEGERVGSGLGLAICKAIVEAHHGNIGVNSQLGHGSTFWFKIPQAPTS